MQHSNKSKDIHVFSIDANSPTLVKKPEKLRAGSPVPTEMVHAPQKLITRNPVLPRTGSPETVQAPRRLPPLQRPPSAMRPPPLETTEQDVPDIRNDETNSMFLSREFQDGQATDMNSMEFDGRAIDPGKQK